MTLNLLLVRYIGLFAIILSTVLSYIIVTIPWLIHNLFSVVFNISSKEFIRKFIIYVFVVFLSALISFGVCNLSSLTGIVSIILRLIISIIIPNVVYLILLRHEPEFEGSLEMVDRLTQNRLIKFTNIFRKRV